MISKYLSYVTDSSHYWQGHISFSGEKIAYVCATLENDADERNDSHLFCPDGNEIEITEAIFGGINDTLKCNITNEKIPCQSSNGLTTC